MYHALGLFLMFCVMTSLALVMHGRWFGMRPGVDNMIPEWLRPAIGADISSSDIVTDGDKLIINTSDLCKDISGYAGPVPVEIYITGEKIDSVKALENSETESFFERVTEAGLQDSWNGLTLSEASSKKVDAVSGATYSSNTLIANVRAGVAKAAELRGVNAEKAKSDNVSILMICVWIVLAMGAILPLFIKGKAYRIIQQFLNVGVLGFWSGTFLDYSLLLNVFANGLQFTFAAVATWILLIVGFIFPLFGKKKHYCLWVCPFGSMQDLAGSIIKHKLRIGKRTLAVLSWFRRALWVVLLLMLWGSWGIEWLNYEIFTAFIVQSAAKSVIWVGLGFVVLSIIIARPFCRFVCPVGTLLRKSEGD